MSDQPRRPVSEMTDSDKLDEILSLLRAFEAAFNAFANSPMARMIPGGVPPMAPNGKR